MKTLKQITEMADTHSFHPDWKERVHARGATKYTFHPTSKRTTAETKDGHIVGTWNHEHSEGHIHEDAGGFGSHAQHHKEMAHLEPTKRAKALHHYNKASAATAMSRVDDARHHWTEYHKILGEGHGAFADWARENKVAKHRALTLSKPPKFTPEHRAQMRADKKKHAELRDHRLAMHIADEVGQTTPDVDPFEQVRHHAIHKLGYNQHDVHKHMDRVTRKHLGHKDYNDYVEKTAAYARRSLGIDEVTLKRPGAQRVLEAMVVNSGPDVQLLKRFKKKGSNPVKEDFIDEANKKPDFASEYRRIHNAASKEYGAAFKKIGAKRWPLDKTHDLKPKHEEAFRKNIKKIGKHLIKDKELAIPLTVMDAHPHAHKHRPALEKEVFAIHKKYSNELQSVKKTHLKEDFIGEAGTKKKSLGVIRGTTATGQKANPINVKPELRNPKDKKALKSFRTLGR